MGNFRRDNNFRGRDNRDRGGNRGGRGSRFGGQIQMHTAICAECGEQCEVPFKPTGEKPVLCSECFGRGRSDDRGGRRDGGRGAGRGNNRGNRRDNFPRPNPSNEKLDEMNAKLDQILELLQTKKVGKTYTVKKETTKKATPAKKTAAKKTPAKKKTTKKK